MPHLTLGSAPVSESCAQLGITPDYEAVANRECGVYRDQLVRIYQEAHGGRKPPFKLVIKDHPHDFGTYYEVGVDYQDDDQEELEAVFWLDGNTPESWDSEARKALGLPEEPVE